MSGVAPGWFPDPENPAQNRWWDGVRWTATVAPPAPPVGTLPPPSPVRAAPTWVRRVPTWGWIVGSILALGLLLLASPVVALAALVVAITGVVALVRNKPTWLRFPSRTHAAVWTSTAAVVFFVAGSVSGAMNPPKPDAAEVPPAPAAATATGTPTPTASATPFADDVAALAEFAGQAGTVSDASATMDRTALAVLDTLEVKGRAPKTGYDREQFGQRWLDVDRNGCDTRNDTLARDLTDVVRSGPCKVMSGTLLDPYTGATLSFVRGQGTSELVQIDHVVSLSDAWQKGAQQLSADQRASFANDPMNVLAVDGAANAQKGDGDAATWLPKDTSYRCSFVATQIAVKATYGLWVTDAEQQAMRRVLESCPEQAVVTSSFAAAAPAVVVEEPAPVVEPVVEPAPAPEAPAPAPVEQAPAPAPPAATFYQNCDAVRAAGAAPLYEGSPGYSRKLDRDGDGVACE